MPNIRVAVRVRPMNKRERARSSSPCIVVQDGTQINVNDPDDKMGGIDYLRLDKNRDKAYAFDLAFDESISQQDVYEKTTRHVIDGVLRGTNACCFAYGATGSGKTYTMTGVPGQPGVIPLTVAGLFEAIDASKTRVVVRLQYVEIYNEVVKDLLDPSDKITLDVREDPRQGTFVAGAASLVVGSREAVEDMLARGNQFRTTSATGCNEVSSRSHAVLQLRLETEKEGGAKAIGKLALIDLAGSERATKTDNRGQRLNEGANINRSLLALANCINALVQGGGPGAGRGRGHAHVPYRDSKLTRLLKDSLGGKSTTCIITNVSPASDQFEETINTLKYANRAKNIKTKAIEVRVERGPALAPPTFAPTVKYEPAAAVEVRGVEDFLVRQERARLRQQQGGGGGLTRAASVPEARRGSVPAQAGAQRGPPRVAGRKAIRQPASDGSLPVARGNQLAGARGDAARPNPVSTGPSDPSSSGKSSLGLAAQKLQTVIAERVALVRREAIEAKIEQVRREEEQRRMEESFGGSKPRFR